MKPSLSIRLAQTLLKLVLVISAGLQAATAMPMYGSAQGKGDFLSGYDISCLTMADGLRHNFIDEIYRDSRGFLWLGYGGGGLARYDGYEFVNFYVNCESYPLCGNFAPSIVEDPFGRLWVATEGGIAIINVYSLQPAAVTDLSGMLADIRNKSSLALALDAENRLWANNGDNIYAIKFDQDGNVVATAGISSGHRQNGAIAVKDVMADGHPWTGLNGVIVRLVPDFDRHSIVTERVSDSLVGVRDLMVSDFVADGTQVWIATDRGLLRYSPAENKSKNYAFDPSDPCSLSQNFVNSIALSSEGRLIVGTLHGLSVYNPLSDNFERIGLGRTRPLKAGLNNLFVNKVYVDGKRIWVGTEGGGLNSLTAKRLYSVSLPGNFGAPGLLSFAPVNSILAEPDGNVWIGSTEGGLHHTSDNYNTFRHFSAESGHLEHNSVSALARDAEGRLWVGTWGGGVNILDTGGACRRVAHHIYTTDHKCHLGYVGALISDPVTGCVWIGTSRGVFVHFPDGTISEVYPGVSEEIVGAIGAVIDENRHLWIGSVTGLLDIDLKAYARKPSRESLRIIKGHLDNPSSVSDERITFLFIDHENTLWIGTNGSGLYKRIVKDGKERFEVMTTSSGLPNDVVHGIAEDREGNLWVSTYSGLARLGHDRTTFSTYDCSDGLESDCFYWNAAHTDAEGNVLFGTVKGLAILTGYKPDKDMDMSSPLNFTHIKVDNHELSINEDGSCFTFCPEKGLTVHEGFRSVSFEFSSLDYERRKGGVYAYRLNGFDPSWTVLPVGRRFVSYTNLAPGKYTLQVSYRYPGQKDGEQMLAAMPITVTPYFYKQWWFILFAVLTILSLVYFVYRHRVWSLKNNQRVLEETVAQRTSEIEEHKRQVQQLTMDRINFFTNITHEFRTPITLIIGPIERALKLSYNPQVIEQLHFVERNSKYLLSLVNQLMDFRKLESGKMEIMLTKADLKEFLYNLIGSFRPMADDRHIKLDLSAHLPKSMVNIDVEALQKVLINLLGNAVKFSPEGGHITVYATILPEACGKGQRSIYLSVCDSGNGIAPEDIEHIFDRFYQGKSSIRYPVTGMAGSGIGLYLCRSLIELYGGDISVRNNPSGCGCTFRVKLPLSADNILEEASEHSAKEPVSGPASVVVPEESETGDSRMTILVVEDNDDMRSFIRSILSDRFNVAEARNGEEALKVLSSREISLIISDLMMPVMDGIELSRRVKETFEISHIPFLMLTAKTARESRLESFRIGVDEYILKPFDEELLLARIDNILENKRRYQKRFAGHLEVDTLNIDEDSRDKKFMNQVMKVIRENYKNSYFEVGDFAEALGVSRSLLNKKLQSIAGQSAGQLLRAFRLNTARELLVRNRKTKAMNISEIAYEVGFNDSKYFTRCFTKQFNVTPSSILNGD